MAVVVGLSGRRPALRPHQPVGKLVGTGNKDDVTKDEVLTMIIMGKLPDEVTDRELAESHGG